MQLNASKSEAIIVGTAAQAKKLNNHSKIAVAGAPLNLSDDLRIIGVTINNRLNLNKHVTNICRTSNYHIRALRHIRPLLDEPTANQLACSIVNSRLDYCNSILHNTSCHNIAQLQRVQNNLTRVVCRAPRRSSPSALLKRLHWLPIEHRIRYKIASITHHALVDSSPGYLHELLTPHTPSRNLRSAGKALLVTPNTRTRVGDKSFKAAAPNVWNRLPETIRTISCHNTFKKNLKTVLFKEAFFDS